MAALVHEPVGPRVRRNGQIYYPRNLEGYEDLWFYQEAQRRFHHILLSGPPGSGKTAGCEAAFDSAPMDERLAPSDPLGIYTLIGSDSITTDDFVGSWVQDPKTGFFEWVHGPLTRSIIDNVPFLVDEVALIDPKVLSLLYPLMDGRGRLEITQNPALEPFLIKDGWFVVAAYNPDVPGAYISEALLDRFHHRIEVETDWNLALRIGVPSPLVRAAQAMNMQRAQGSMSWSPQFRSLLSFKDNLETFGSDFAIKDLISKTPKEDRGALVDSLVRFKVGDPNSYQALRLGESYEDMEEMDDFA